MKTIFCIILLVIGFNQSILCQEINEKNKEDIEKMLNLFMMYNKTQDWEKKYGLLSASIKMNISKVEYIDLSKSIYEYFNKADKNTIPNYRYLDYMLSTYSETKIIDIGPTQFDKNIISVVIETSKQKLWGENRSQVRPFYLVKENNEWKIINAFYIETDYYVKVNKSVEMANPNAKKLQSKKTWHEIYQLISPILDGYYSAFRQKDIKKMYSFVLTEYIDDEKLDYDIYKNILENNTNFKSFEFIKILDYSLSWNLREWKGRSGVDAVTMDLLLLVKYKGRYTLTSSWIAFSYPPENYNWGISFDDKNKLLPLN